MVFSTDGILPRGGVMGNNEHSYLSVGEFQRSMQALERAVTTGFARTDARLENIETAQNDHGERLAVIEATNKAKTRKALGWSAVATTGVVTLLEAVKTYFRK
jgi:hypothetical protein